jgi:2-methylisocitrate lyase-like PEP mutase family enzyme
MSDQSIIGQRLKLKIQQRAGMIVAGAANALAARVIQQVGFEAVYLSGAGLTNTFYGMPDMGFVGLSDLVSHTSAIRDAIDLPIIVDADTGFGNALNVRHTVKSLERAGANAIQLEDQVMPKKCGHFSGKEVISTKEMVAKVKAAVDARQSENFLIIARTDARAVNGIDDAIDRAQQYHAAGADMTFVEAPINLDELRRIPQEIQCPQIVNVVIGGKTPTLNATAYAEMGFSIVLYANAALQGALRGMTNALELLKKEGQLNEDLQWVASFEERQAIVQKSFFDELDKKYSS